MFNLKYFLLFFGYQRSGHSFVASLIDAHKNAVISDEYHVLMNFKKNRHKRDKIFDDIMDNSFKKTLANKSRRSRFLFENEYQGRYSDELNIIGDKKGGKTSIYFLKNPNLIKEFQKEINLPFKYIHVIRNPFDMITTTKFRLEKKHGKKISIESQINSFEIMCRKASRIREFNIDFIDIYHENIILNSDSELVKILNFLNLENYDNFLNNCKQVIYNNLSRSRFNVDWRDKDKKRVYKNLIEKYDFLNHYSFED